MKVNLFQIKQSVYLQVYLVTGGYDNSYRPMDSTELLVEGSDSWNLVGKLPSAAAGLQGISVNGSIIVSGKISHLTYDRTFNPPAVKISLIRIR